MNTPITYDRHRLAFIISFITFISLSSSTYGMFGKGLYWPTPNQAFLEGKSSETYLQATASGRIESGDWGCSRNNGYKYHEGIDLKSINRIKGIAKDSIFAAADGVIAHVSYKQGNSNYGIYVVISHMSKGLEWCTLYAHLRSVEPGIRVGQRVKAGQKIATMGHTSSSIKIPESRSHLHFEVALRNSSRFQHWYNKQEYSTPNKHGSWNGMNLTGINPIKFYRYFLDHPEEDFFSFFLKEPVSFEALVYFNKKPDFLFRNPIFLRGKPIQQKASWYMIGFTWYGLPVNWVPVSDKEVTKQLNKEEINIIGLRHEKNCRNWVDEVNDHFLATKLLKKHIAQLRAGD